MRWLFAAVLLVGCKDEPAPKPMSATPPPRVYDAAPVPTALPPGDDGKPNQADRKDGEALLAGWLSAQNQGDFAAYQKLYGDTFIGVRRSGAKVRRFDRAGWMADRGRMFAKPMVVAADGLSAMSHGAQTHLFFTQSFEQGSYKDTGRKWMALERTGDGLRIVREEMLDSTLIAKQSQELASAKADPAGGGAALAPGEVQLGWTGKRDKLYLAPVDGERLFIGRASGSIGTGPVTVADHTFDSASGTLAGVSATRAVDTAKLPKPLADRLGKAVQLLDGDLAALCHAKIIGYSLRVIDWAPEKASGSQEEAAAALLDDAPVVVAALQMSGCPKGAEFAREVDLPPLPNNGSFTEDKAMRKAIDVAADAANTELVIMPVEGDAVRVVAAASGHTEDSCETQEEYRTQLLLLTRKGKTWSAEALATYTYEDVPLVAVDADHDGTIDVFTRLGAHRGSESDFWENDIRVFWPPGLGCDGCEGDECGD